MRLEEKELEIFGTSLRQFLFLPDDPGEVRASAILIHGHGDYSSRYDETMELFTGLGVSCVATDLPGHGQSPGRRGIIPSFALVDEVLRRSEERSRTFCPSGPFGLLGHSAGGLIGLRSILADPGRYDFAWISSPLVKPDANKNRFLRFLLPLLARLLPNLTVNTLVTPEQLWREDKISQIGEEAFENPQTFHTRIGLRWGYELILAADAVCAGLVAEPPNLPLLITQVSDDPVCPVEYLHPLLERAALPHLRYVEFPGMLHEPFADGRRHEVFAEIERWMGEILEDGTPA